MSGSRYRVGTLHGALRFWAGQARYVRRSKDLPFRSKLRYLWLRLALELGRLPTAPARIRVSGFTLVVSPEDFVADLATFAEIFVLGEYAGLPVRDAHVLDLSAHKGYFGVWALRHGAALVSSYEPAPSNFAALAETRCAAGDRWLIYEEAVGAAAGSARLRLAESWTHSISRQDDMSPEASVPISVVAISDVIRRATAASTHRLVLKIDVEGSEHEIICDDGRGIFASIDAMAVDDHSNSTEGRERLIRALLESDQELTRSNGNVLFFSRLA